jgi:TATA-binding protein-associated factor Taf7
MIVTLEQYKKAKKALITPAAVDRAGAANVHIENEIITRLKDLHSLHYVSENINWARWANIILSSDAHRHEALICSAPPASIIGLFTMARLDDQVQHRQSIQANQVCF